MCASVQVCVCVCVCVFVELNRFESGLKPRLCELMYLCIVLCARTQHRRCVRLGRRATVLLRRNECCRKCHGVSAHGIRHDFSGRFFVSTYVNECVSVYVYVCVCVCLCVCVCMRVSVSLYECDRVCISSGCVGGATGSLLHIASHRRLSAPALKKVVPFACASVCTREA